MTGKYPAVFGWDAGLALRGAEKPGSGADKNANAKALAQNITDADSKGAIVTLSAHWCNPGTGKDFNDTTAVASELLPGGKYSGTFNKELDAIAATAQQAKRSDGTLIPIIFRPLHENNGSWFWWGATHASASEYKELYRYIVDYLRDVKDVHNLLYAYSPAAYSTVIPLIISPPTRATSGWTYSVMTNTIPMIPQTIPAHGSTLWSRI